METFLSMVKPLIIGFVLGSVFSFFKLPIPAPPTIQGVLGIVGLTAGYLVVSRYF